MKNWKGKIAFRNKYTSCCSQHGKDRHFTHWYSSSMCGWKTPRSLFTATRLWTMDRSMLLPWHLEVYLVSVIALTSPSWSTMSGGTVSYSPSKMFKLKKIEGDINSF